MVWFYLVNSDWYPGMAKLLSIPLWSDFITLLPTWFLMSVKTFQSHYGLILSFYVVATREINFVFRLSIPLWSDFIAKYIPSRLLTPVDFQSHYGLILSFEKIDEEDCWRLLSIPLWSDFIKVHRYEVRRRLLQLSIPLWSDFIGQKAWDAEKIDKIVTFNPTMVWFYRYWKS